MLSLESHRWTYGHMSDTLPYHLHQYSKKNWEHNSKHFTDVKCFELCSQFTSVHPMFYISTVKKTGSIIQNLVRISDQNNTNKVQLHVLSVFSSTLLPALIALHIKTFSPQVILMLQDTSLIDLNLELKRAHQIRPQVPKGKLIYVKTKSNTNRHWHECKQTGYGQKQAPDTDP